MTRLRMILPATPDRRALSGQGDGVAAARAAAPIQTHAPIRMVWAEPATIATTNDGAEA